MHNVITCNRDGFLCGVHVDEKNPPKPLVLIKKMFRLQDEPRKRCTAGYRGTRVAQYETEELGVFLI